MEELEAPGFDEARTDRAGNVVGRIAGAGGAPAVMLSSHMDVVDVGDPAGWEHDPYGGIVADGCLHGRGAMELKGPLAIHLYAVARFVEERCAATSGSTSSRSSRPRRPQGDVWSSRGAAGSGGAGEGDTTSPGSRPGTGRGGEPQRAGEGAEPDRRCAQGHATGTRPNAPSIAARGMTAPSETDDR